MAYEQYTVFTPFAIRPAQPMYCRCTPTVAAPSFSCPDSSNTATTSRDGSIGLTPPVTGPLSLFAPTDASASGSNAFDGRGQTGASNSLTGEITVTVAEVFPNGTMRVRGEKQLRINRGHEFIRLSGLVRFADVGPDNRVASTRVADAQIEYLGRGEVARASRQGWLQRFFTILSPF